MNEKTYVVSPARIVSSEERFTVGEIEFVVNVLGSAHSDGDMTLYVQSDNVLFSGDIIFEGRVPFVGDANTRNWLAILKKMETSGLKALIPGHGPAAKQPDRAIKMTRHYLEALRGVMGDAARDLSPFAEAYDAADWSEFEKLPAFDLAHRRNAYQVYLSMEVELANE